MHLLKQKNRCIIKSKLEYNKKKWPYSSNIIDIIRCSITFHDINHFLNAFNRFYNDFKSDMANSSEVLSKREGCIKGIVRIKNGFSLIGDNVSLLSLDKINYSDIKCNILIEYNNIRIIGEIQFLLSIFLNFKKKQHSLYSFKRNKQLYEKLYKYNKNINDNNNNNIKYNIFNKIILLKNINKFYLNLTNLSLNDKYYILKNKNKIYKLLDINNWIKGKELFDNIIEKLEKEQLKI